MKIIQKPWGQEELIEVNANYMLKKLTMKKGHRCSLQYHNIKKEKKVFKYKKVNRFELDRIKLIVLASFILIIFWASFEQAGGLMNIFAYQKTDRFIGFLNFEVPASWFQSINPLMIIFLGFSVAQFWFFIEKKKNCNFFYFQNFYWFNNYGIRICIYVFCCS